ncbi:MAG: lipoprotein-releasing ABC transporter permease subunit [Deltaproteobacteria bacterium]|nr:lipoprotein-releasing ABC transporter permease subunit [Deltaproteobacteria bacterium]
MSWEIFISGRYLRSRRREVFVSMITAISVCGVTVGVMALIVVIAVMTGFSEDLKSRILSVTPHVSVYRYGGAFAGWRPVLDWLEKQQDVTHAAPFIQGQALLRSPAGTSGCVLRGLDPEREAAEGGMGRLVKSGSLSELNPPPGSGSPPGVILGVELARSLGLSKGDPVYVISPRGVLSPMGPMPSLRRLSVVGMMESGMYDYDSSFCWVSLSTAQNILRMDGEITGIQVSVADVYRAGALLKKIAENLGFPYWARDWMSANRNLFAALKLEKVTMFIILTLLVLVAAFNIAATLIMMVTQRRKDIAILKAMGATNRSIRKIFVANGMVIGMVGTALGVLLGSVLCLVLDRYQFIKLDPNVYYISTLPVRMEFWDVLSISVSALAICFLATLYPAWKAARLDPVEAIRYE